MRVLCVEDEAAIREDIADYLRMHAYEVDEADGAEQAVDRLHKRHYDVVLCDVRMPQMDGYDLLEKVRSDQNLASLPFVFLTAFGEKSDKIRAHRSGCDSFLTKPIDFAVLDEVLKSNIARQRTREKIAGQGTELLAGHVVQAVSESLHRPMAEAIATVEYLRELKDKLSVSVLDQSLYKLENTLNDHMQELFLLVGAMQLQLKEANGPALSYEPMTSAEIRQLILPGRPLKHDLTQSSAEATLMIDRTLVHKALSHLVKIMPKSAIHSDSVQVLMDERETRIYLAEPDRQPADDAYVTLGAAVDLTVAVEMSGSYLIPLMFAMQVAHAHGGKLAIRPRGDYLAIRMTLPRKSESQRAAQEFARG